MPARRRAELEQAVRANRLATPAAAPRRVPAVAGAEFLDRLARLDLGDALLQSLVPMIPLSLPAEI